MSDGIWLGTQGSEAIRQGKLTRERFLTVNCGQDLATGWNGVDASGMASLDPNSISPNTHNAVTDRGPEGGPHFIMSGRTPDESHTYGFEFALSLYGLSGGDQAAPAVGGYTVTVWALITVTQSPNGAFAPMWASLQTVTGVGLNELWHSFSINARAIRFQFNASGLLLDPTTHNKSIGIAFNEL